MLAKPDSGQSQVLQDADLKDRIANSDLIVVGQVSGIRALPELNQGPISHKNPLLQIATINVQSVEKGAAPQSRVDVAYANSRDVSWYRSWKAQIGQQGIWLLQEPQKHGLDMQSSGAPGTLGMYSALRPGDFQTKDQLERIRTFLH